VGLLAFRVADPGTARFADVMNLLESACAIFDEKLFVGKVGRLLEDYLCHVFILIQQSDDARTRIERLMMTERTFEHIVKFLQRHRESIKGIILPVPRADSD
jgi:hypothetical protein